MSIEPLKDKNFCCCCLRIFSMTTLSFQLTLKILLITLGEVMKNKIIDLYFFPGRFNCNQNFSPVKKH